MPFGKLLTCYVRAVSVVRIVFLRQDEGAGMHGRIPVARRRMGRHHHLTRERLMLTVLGGRCRVRARPYPGAHLRGPRAGESARRESGAQAEAHPAPEAGNSLPQRERRDRA
jgi:hypothetical protein